MTLATTCPQCKTSFKVVPDQMKLRRGLVRCGRCHHVFSGIDSLTYIEQPAQHEPAAAIDGPDPQEEPPTIVINLPGHPTISSPEAEPPTAPLEDGAVVDALPASQQPTEFEADLRQAPMAPEVIGPLYETDPLPLDAIPDPRQRRRPVMAMLIAAALLLTLLAQAVVGWRDAIASRIPELGAPLNAAFKPLGLSAEPERNRAALTIESFELSAGKLPGQLELTALIRNRSAHPVAFPAMELSLSGSSGGVLIRKVIAARDYLGKPELIKRGVGGQSEWPVRLTLETDGVQASAYSVDLFYP